MISDYMKIISKMLKVRFEIIRLHDWQEVLKKAENKKIDLVPAIVNTQKRRKYLLFTKPYLFLEGVIITKIGHRKINSLSDIRKDENISVVKGYVWDELIKKDYPNINRLLAKNPQEAVRNLAMGNSDYMISALPIAVYYINQEGISGLSISGNTEYKDYLSMGVRDDLPILRQILEKVLINIPKDLKDKIYKKYITLDEVPFWQNTIFRKWVFSIALILIVLFLIIITWNITLKAQVERQTSKIKKQKERLFQSEKMNAIGRLSGGIAHDFNNILSVIQMQSELLKIKLSAEDPSQKYINEIQKSIEHASDLTNQLLLFSRKNKIDTKPLDINTIIKNMKNMLESLVRKNIKFDIELLDKPIIVEVDQTQFQQIILNLCINSQDAIDGKGQILIETKVCKINEENDLYGLKNGEYAVLSIKDDGCGIDEETKKNIFEPFYTTKEKGKGTGLGLSIIHSIVTGLDGNIFCKSTLGKGTSFDIFLPLSAKKNI